MKALAPDLRVEKTVAKLEQALFRLLGEKDLLEITVKELCALAGVTRSTFYSYFHSVGDLRRYFVEHYIREFREEMTRCWTSTDNIKAYYLHILRYIRKKREIFLCLYTGGEGFMEQTLPLINNSIGIGNDPTRNPLDDRMVKIFNAYGGHGMIKQWLLGKCKEPTEEIAELLYQYTVRILSLPAKAPS